MWEGDCGEIENEIKTKMDWDMAKEQKKNKK